MKLEHLFVHRCLDRNELLFDSVRLNTFLNRVKKQAIRFGKNDEDQENKYKGWALELFAEFLCKSFPMDKRVGILNYKPGEEDEDTGVDGYGIGINGNPATVQVKFRDDNYVLETNKDHLSNFTSTSMIKFGVKPEDNSNMLIITTGKELHFTAKNMFGGKVRTLGRDQLRKIVDRNVVFWTEFLKSWNESM